MKSTSVVRSAVTVIDLSKYGPSTNFGQSLRKLCALWSVGSRVEETGKRRQRVAVGMDVGTRHVGLAVSDMQGRIAFPVRGFVRGSIEHDVREVGAVVRDSGARLGVIGVPVVPAQLRGQGGEAVRRFAIAYGVAIFQRCGISVIALSNENYSTAFAREGLIELNVTKARHDMKYRKRALDAVSLTFSYLIQSCHLHKTYTYLII